MSTSVKYIPGIEVGSSSPLNMTHLFSFTSEPKQNSKIRQIHYKMNYNAEHTKNKIRTRVLKFKKFTLTHQNDILILK